MTKILHVEMSDFQQDSIRQELIRQSDLVVPTSQSDLFEFLASLLSQNDYFGADVPSRSSDREGAVLFWKLVSKSAELYAFVENYLSIVANQTNISIVGGRFLDAVGSLFGMSRSGTVGVDMESDVHFKNRINYARGGRGVDFVEAMKSRLRSIGTIKDSVIIENVTGLEIEDNGVKVSPHSVYVALDGKDNDEENLLAARVFFDAKDCGCGMVPQIPKLSSGQTYRGLTLTDIESVPTSTSLDIFNASSRLTPTSGDVVAYAPSVNTVNYAKLYQWNGTTWTKIGDSNIRSVNIHLDGLSKFNSIINRVDTKRFFVRSFVRPSVSSEDYEELKANVKTAVANWQNGEVDGVDGLGVGRDAIRYECGAAISAQIKDLKVYDVQFFTGSITLSGGYSMFCRYVSAGDRSGTKHSHSDERVRFDSTDGKFYIDYSFQTGGTTTQKQLTFQGVETDSSGVTSLHYKTNVFAYRVPPGESPTPPSSTDNFVIYRGVEHNNDKRYYYGFQTLQQAFDNARDGERIFMLNDVTTTEQAILTEHKTVWLDFAGPSDRSVPPTRYNLISHMYTFNGNGTLSNKYPGAAIAVDWGGTLYIIDSTMTSTYSPPKTNGFRMNTTAGTEGPYYSIVARSFGTIIYDGPWLIASGTNGGIAATGSVDSHVIFKSGNTSVPNGNFSCIYATLEIQGGDHETTGSNGTCIFADFNSTVNVKGGDYNVVSGAILDAQGAKVTISDGMYYRSDWGSRSGSKGYLFTPTTSKTYGAIDITGGYFFGWGIGSKMSISGSPIFRAANIYGGSYPLQGGFTSGFYILRDNARKTLYVDADIDPVYVSGTTVTESHVGPGGITETYRKVGNPTWVPVSDLSRLGNIRRQETNPPPVDTMVAIAEGYDVYDDIDVYIYCKDSMNGAQMSVYSEDGSSVSVLVNEEYVEYQLPVKTGATIPLVDPVVVTTGETRLCDEADVVSVTNAEKAYCVGSDNNMDGISVYVQDYVGTIVPYVDFDAPAIDTYYVPNNKTSMSIRFSFNGNVTAGQLIAGYSGRPKYEMNQQGYALYVESVDVASYRMSLTWRIGTNYATITGVGLKDTISAVVSPTGFTIDGYGSQVISIPTGQDFKVNSIRLFKEAEITGTTSSVRIHSFKIFNDGSPRVDMVPFHTNGGRTVLLDRVTGVTFG